MAKKSKKKPVSLAPIRGLIPIQTGDQDGPTVERLAKLPGVTILNKTTGRRVAAIDPGMPPLRGADGVMRVSQTALERLAAQKRLHEADRDLNQKLFEAGDRLRHHHYLAGLDGGPGSIDLNRSGGGNGHPSWLIPGSESAAYHRQSFRRARESMEPGHWQVVFAICCGDATLESTGRDAGFQNRGAAAAVAIDRLRRGLELLALAWGILPPRPANDDHAANPAARVVTKVVEGDQVGAIIDRMVVANEAAALRETG